MNRNRRRATLALELQIDDTLDLAECGRDFVGTLVELIEVVTEYLDSYLGGFAAQALADTVAQKRDHLTLYARIMLQNGAQLFLRGALVNRGIRFQLDVKLAAVRAPGILAQLGTTDLLFDALHVRQREDFPADARTEAEHLIQ